jgi:hypothetical protein
MSPSTLALSNNRVSEYMHTILLPVAIVSCNHDYISKLGIWVFDTHSYQLWYSIWYPARVWCFCSISNTHPHSGLNPRTLWRSQGPRMGYSNEPSTLGSKSWFWKQDLGPAFSFFLVWEEPRVWFPGPFFFNHKILYFRAFLEKRRSLVWYLYS